MRELQVSCVGKDCRLEVLDGWSHHVTHLSIVTREGTVGPPRSNPTVAHFLSISLQRDSLLRASLAVLLDKSPCS